MPRSKAGIKSGFLNDQHAIDSMKVMFFVGTFETAVMYLASSSGNIGLDMIRVMLYMLGLPTTGTAGNKALLDIYEKTKDTMEDVSDTITDKTGGPAHARELWEKWRDEVRRNPTPWLTPTSGAGVAADVLTEEGIMQDAALTALSPVGAVVKDPKREAKKFKRVVNAIKKKMGWK